MMTDGTDSKIITQFKKTIDEMIKDGIKRERITTYITAVVSKVNQDGTFDVYFPPDQSSTKTGLLNKSHDTLLVGDTVEVCTKNGSLSNSWIALRHGPSDSGGGGGGGGGVETITVGETTTLPPGSDATVINSGSNTNMVLNFGIPKGQQGIQGVRGEPGRDGTDGVDGTAATIQIGSVTSGTVASVTNVGTQNAAIFNFVLPNGDATRWYVGNGTPTSGNYTPGDMYLNNLTGDLYYFDDTEQWVFKINIKGPRGNDGDGFRVIGAASGMDILSVGANQIVTSELPIHYNNSTSILEDVIRTIIREQDIVKHPIGSLEFNTSGINPNTYFGFGTWELWGKGQVPVGVDPDDEDYDSAEMTGGNKTINLSHYHTTGDFTLLAEHLPKHSFSIDITTTGAGGHRHQVTGDTWGAGAHSHAAGSKEAGKYAGSGTWTVLRPYGWDSNGDQWVSSVGDHAHHMDFWSQSVGDHTHNVKGNTNSIGEDLAHNHGNTGNALGDTDIRQPYITCYMWKRIA